MLAFTWAGTQYAWLSPQILGLFAFSIVTLTTFTVYEIHLERQGGQPVIAPGLFKNRTLESFHNPQILLSPGELEKTRMAFAAQGPQAIAIFNQVIEAMKLGLVQGIHDAFLLSVLVMALGLIALLFLPELELRGGPTASSQGEKVAEAVAVADSN